MSTTRSTTSRTRQPVGLSEQIVSMAKANPEGVLLLAAGAVLLMRKTLISPSTPRRHSTHMTEGMPGEFRPNSGLSELADETRELAGDVASRVGEAASALSSSARDYAGRAGNVIGEHSQRAWDQTHATGARMVDGMLADRPLVVAAMGLAAGAAVAAAFPATAFEREAMRPVGDQIAGARQRLSENFSEAASRATDKLREVVSERGLNAEGLKDAASEVGAAFQSGLNKTDNDQHGSDHSNKERSDKPA